MSASIEPMEEYMPTPGMVETNQDHPALLDWRLVALLTLIGVTLYFLV